jgi:hypothetical protein
MAVRNITVETGFLTSVKMSVSLMDVKRQGLLGSHGLSEKK